MSDLTRKSHNVSLFKHFKYSTGVRLRLIFFSVVLSADVATGSEGKEVTVFLDMDSKIYTKIVDLLSGKFNHVLNMDFHSDKNSSLRRGRIVKFYFEIMP
jgi:hypothetical protein